MADIERDMLLELIESFRGFRCLWDMKSSMYSNRELRTQAMDHLLQIFLKYQPDGTPESLKRKLDNLRCGFKRESRKVKASQRTGAGKGQLYTPRLWYYEYLTFLEEKETIAGGIDTQDDEEIIITDQNESIAEDTGTGDEAIKRTSGEGTSLHQPRKKVRKPTTLDRKREELLDSVQSLIKSTDSEWEIVGKSLGLQLSKLEESQRDIAQKLISDVIFFGKRGQLNDHSLVLANSSHPATGFYVPSPLLTSYPNRIHNSQFGYYPPTHNSSISTPSHSPSPSPSLPTNPAVYNNYTYQPDAHQSRVHEHESG